MRPNPSADYTGKGQGALRGLSDDPSLKPKGGSSSHQIQALRTQNRISAAELIVSEPSYHSTGKKHAPHRRRAEAKQDGRAGGLSLELPRLAVCFASAWTWAKPTSPSSDLCFYLLPLNHHLITHTHPHKHVPRCLPLLPPPPLRCRLSPLRMVSSALLLLSSRAPEIGRTSVFALLFFPSLLLTSPLLPSYTAPDASSAQPAPLLPPPTLMEILSSFSSHGNNDRALLLSILAAKQAEDERLAREWKYRAQMLVAWARGNGLVPAPQTAGGLEAGQREGWQQVPGPSQTQSAGPLVSPPLSTFSAATDRAVKAGGKRWSSASSTSSTASAPPTKRSRINTTATPTGLVVVAPPSPPISVASSSRNNSTSSSSSDDHHTRAMALVRARLLAARQKRRQSSSTSEDEDDAEEPRTPEQGVAPSLLAAVGVAVGGGKRIGLGMGDLLCDGRAGGGVEGRESWVRT